ncbi:helix-turn-helix domain-containing protein [uncultured Rothia sp.]|uniref:helix-turn-helix domain-containing protein n=1 Tax=uncultured Rothia sp. TaxID=316088 RepID=UPI00288C4ED4|nr:helix-turn-helix domain-containing protein [uncultured Rothia sp.]
MTTTLTSPLEEDTLNQARAEAREILKNSEETTIELTGRESQQLGDALNQVIQHVLHALASGQSIDVQVVPHDLTTTVAAQRIGISRPTLMKAIRAGELPAHKVGSHFRIRTEDADAFRKGLLKKTVAQKEQALKELWELEEEHGLVDTLGGPAW